MASIYDKQKNVEVLDGGSTESTSRKSTIVRNEYIPAPVVKKEVTEQLENTLPYKNIETDNLEVRSFYERSENAMRLVDDIVLKNYLTKLEQMDIVPCADKRMDDIILFKINKMVYEKDEYATDKFISVVSAMTYADCSIFLLVEGLGDTTDFYLGIKSGDDKRGHSSIAETFRNSILGQFPGAAIEDLSLPTDIAGKYTKQHRLLDRITEDVACVSSCIGIPSYKNSKGEHTNANFIQGIEKFAMAMQGKRYTAIILATNTSSNEITSIRNGYENIYTELSAMATRQLAYSTNESLANAISRTKGYSDTEGQTQTFSVSKSKGTSKSKTKGTSSSITKTKGTTKDNFWGGAGKLAEPLMTTGAVLTATGVGAPVGAIITGVGVVAGIGGLVGSKQKSESTGITEGENHSETRSESETRTRSKSDSTNTSHTESFQETNGETSTIGTSKNFTITIQNKHILEVQKRIDKQLERIEQCESSGLWSAGAYFLSYDTDRATAEIGATIYRSIMQGEPLIKELNATMKKPIVTARHGIFKLPELVRKVREKLEQQANRENKEIAFDGGTIVYNYDEDRLQILFDAVPDSDMRTKLKGNAFKWSPRNQAWQRQLTQNAVIAARRVLNITL